MAVLRQQLIDQFWVDLHDVSYSATGNIVYTICFTPSPVTPPYLADSRVSRIPLGCELPELPPGNIYEPKRDLENARTLLEGRGFRVSSDSRENTKPEKQVKAIGLREKQGKSQGRSHVSIGHSSTKRNVRDRSYC